MAEEKTICINAFLDGHGKIKNLPAQAAKRTAVLAYLAEKFEAERDYTEKEINAILIEWHTFEDYFILRRELVEHGFLARTRDGAKYWKIKKEENGDGSDGQEKGTETTI